MLTVKRKPAVVVQDARSYRRLLEAIEKAEAIAGINLGLESLGRREGSAAEILGELPKLTEAVALCDQAATECAMMFDRIDDEDARRKSG